MVFGTTSVPHHADVRPLGAAPMAPTSAARVTLAVSYLVSFAHSASCTVLHAYQSVEPHRMALGVPARRVLIIADDRGYTMPDFEASLQRCVSFSRICEVMLLPSGAAGLAVLPGAPPAAPNDIDVLLQQSSPVDFARVLGAVYRPSLSGGSPAILEMDEGQPLAARVNCHLRTAPLKEANIDGISKDALKALSEEHQRQMRALRSSLSNDKQFHVTELNEMYAERDSLRRNLHNAREELFATQRTLREERDALRLQLAQQAEYLRMAREENTMLRLSRLGVQPNAELALPLGDLGAPSPPPPPPSSSFLGRGGSGRDAFSAGLPSFGLGGGSAPAASPFGAYFNSNSSTNNGNNNVSSAAGAGGVAAPLRALPPPPFETMSPYATTPPPPPPPSMSPIGAFAAPQSNYRSQSTLLSMSMPPPPPSQQPFIAGGDARGGPGASPSSSTSTAEQALQRLQGDLRSGEEFLSRLRSSQAPISAPRSDRGGSNRVA